MKRTIIDASQFELNDRVVAIKRVSKTVKGGRTMRFSALVVVGDGNGHCDTNPHMPQSEVVVARTEPQHATRYNHHHDDECQQQRYLAARADSALENLFVPRQVLPYVQQRSEREDDRSDDVHRVPQIHYRAAVAETETIVVVQNVHHYTGDGDYDK